MSKFHSCEEVAKRYGVKIITVWDWIRKGKLGAIRPGRDYLVSDEDLQLFEDASRTKANRDEPAN